MVVDGRILELCVYEAIKRMWAQIIFMRWEIGRKKSHVYIDRYTYMVFRTHKSIPSIIAPDALYCNIGSLYAKGSNAYCF